RFATPHCAEVFGTGGRSHYRAVPAPLRCNPMGDAELHWVTPGYDELHPELCSSASCCARRILDVRSPCRAPPSFDHCLCTSATPGHDRGHGGSRARARSSTRLRSLTQIHPEGAETAGHIEQDTECRATCSTLSTVPLRRQMPKSRPCDRSKQTANWCQE